MRALPLTAGEPPAVRQGIGPVTDAVVGLRWGRHGDWADDSRAGVAVEYVRALLGLPTADLSVSAGQHRVVWPSGDLQPLPAPACSGAGQLRTVVGLYLFAQAQPDGHRWLGSEGLHLGAMQPGAADRAAAATLLDAPQAQVQDVLSRNWSSIRLAKPAGDTLAAFGISGMPVTGEPCP